MSEEHLDWVAQYLVMKRVSIEANFHSLYINFMDTLGSTQLKKMVLRETYRNIKVLVFGEGRKGEGRETVSERERDENGRGGAERGGAANKENK